MILLRDLSQSFTLDGFELIYDTSPDAVADQTKDRTPVNWWVEFDAIQITGIDTQVTASITGGEISVSSDNATFDAFSATDRQVSNNDWIRVRLRSSANWATGTTETLTVGQLSVDYTATTAPTPPAGLPNFYPSELSVNSREINIFAQRENMLAVDVLYQGGALDLTIFDYFELYGLTSQPISDQISADANGRVIMDIGPQLSDIKSADTTLIGHSPYYPYGVVLWHPNLAQSNVAITIIDA